MDNKLVWCCKSRWLVGSSNNKTGVDWATITWRSSRPTPSVLRYGPVGSERGSKVEDEEQKKAHSLRIGSLRPNSSYTAMVHFPNGSTSEPLYFQTVGVKSTPLTIEAL